MRARRRGVDDLCSGPGKLTQALGITLEDNGTDLAAGPVVDRGRAPPGWETFDVVAGPRIGITKAVELPWRFCVAGNRYVSRPWPPGLRRREAPPVAAPRLAGVARAASAAGAARGALGVGSAGVGLRAPVASSGAGAAARRRRAPAPGRSPRAPAVGARTVAASVGVRSSSSSFGG